MDLRVLGPVEAFHHGVRVDLGRRQERFLFAVLLLDVGRVVPEARLVDLLWDTDPPANARRSLQVHASRLRAALRATGATGIDLVSRGHGLVVETDPAQVDAHRFRAAVDLARQESELDRRAITLREALALWRGAALSGVAADDVRERITSGLTELRLSAVELLYDAELALGRQDTVAPELVDLVAEHPARERLTGLLMITWHRQGRTADALALYQRTRASLVDEQGLEPGLWLRGVHRSLLRDEAPEPVDVRPAVRPAPSAWATPAQLPALAGGFTGRERELARLDAAATAQDQETAAVVAVVGSPGVGKTALVLRWAHSAAERFPDGQLFLDLHGYDGNEAVRPLEALSFLLRGLAIPPGEIPLKVDEAAALYRTVMANRRLLVVLDNVRSADQVRPLLPGTPGCAVVITSRDALTGLVARDGALVLALRTLSADESVRLLARVSGLGGAWAVTPEWFELAGACGHLPLALRIAAANIAGQPEISLAEHVATFTSAERLTALDAGDDPSGSVRAAFGLSYARLPAAAQRTFVALGLLPGHELRPETAAVLAGSSVDAASADLRRLADAHLIEARGAGEYVSHDLLRLYAQERARTDLDDAGRSLAVDRLFRFYLRMVDAAARLLYPQMLRLPDDEPGSVTGSELRFAGGAAAAAWLDAEHANLVAAVLQVGPGGRPDLACRLADAMRGHLWMRRDVNEWITIAQCVLAAGESLDDPKAIISATVSLAHAYHCAGYYRESAAGYEHALVLSRAAGWLHAQGTAIGNLAVLYVSFGDVGRVIELTQESIAIYARLGLPAGEAVNVGTLGLAYLMSGQLPQAYETLHRAVDLHRDSGAASMLVMSLCHLGDTCRELGEFVEAREHLRAATELAQRVRHRTGEAVATRYLARLDIDLGQHARGLREAERALMISQESDNAFNISYALNGVGFAHQRAGRAADAVAAPHRGAADRG